MKGRKPALRGEGEAKQEGARIRVGLVTELLTSEHSVRGVGFYTRLLLKNLLLMTRKPNFGKFEIVPISGGVLGKAGESGLSVLHYPHLDLFVPTLKVYSGLPTVVTVHDVIPLRFPEHYRRGLKGSLNLLLQRLALNFVKVVVTDSETSKSDIIKYLGVPSQKIRVVPLAPQFVLKKGVSKEQGERVRKKYHLPRRFVLYVGDVNWNKNLGNLVEACAIADLPLAIVGKHAMEIEDKGDGDLNLFRPRDLVRKWLDMPHPEEEHLVRLRDLFRVNQVMRLGFVSEAELPIVYQLASVYCQPSWWEGFGLNPLEAVSVGCPAVCSDTPALRELLGGAAVFTDPKDPKAMAQALRKALNPGIRKKLILLGKERAKKYNWEKTAEMMFEIYGRVAGAKF